MGSCNTFFDAVDKSSENVYKSVASISRQCISNGAMVLGLYQFPPDGAYIHKENFRLISSIGSNGKISLSDICMQFHEHDVQFICCPITKVDNGTVKTT